MQVFKSDLSVVMVAVNEERVIGQALAAIKPLASEIIVVDSGSTDNTVKVATEHGARIIHRDWKGYANQKNFALEQATCSWILNIDADEILTPDLVQEIKTVLSSGTGNTTAHNNFDNLPAGFKLPRVLYIDNVAVRHGGFYPDAQLRLMRKGTGRFKDRLVHESISVEGPVYTLKHHMLHKAYTNLEEYKNTLDKYAQLSAQEFSLRKSNRRSTLLQWWSTSYLNQCLHPLWTFFYRYVLRLGFLDGVLGLQLACIYSNYVAKKIRYLRHSLNKKG